MIPLRGAAAKGRFPWITLGLIGANVLVFLYTLYIGPQATMNLYFKGGAVPAKLSQFKLLSQGSLSLLATMFISLFLHAGWVHLIGNLWFLWVFGEALEDDLGHGRFLLFYFFAGFFACLFHVLASSRLDAPLIGASGAIAGVMGAYLLRLPQSPILTVVFWRLRLETAQVPAFVWLLLWLGLQFYGLRQGGTVAWVAHLGGFATGLLAVNLFTPLEPRLQRQTVAEVLRPASRRRPGRNRRKS
jgi:membrane associated rhomboid family serine protease